jgi:hypothetical protein
MRVCVGLFRSSRRILVGGGQPTDAEVGVQIVGNSVTPRRDARRRYMDFHRMSVDQGGVSLRHDLANPADGRE